MNTLTQWVGSMAVNRCRPSSRLCLCSFCSSSTILYTSNPRQRIHKARNAERKQLAQDWQMRRRSIATTPLPSPLLRNRWPPSACKPCVPAPGRATTQPANSSLYSCPRTRLNARDFLKKSNSQIWLLARYKIGYFEPHFNIGASTGSSFSEGSDQGFAVRSHFTSNRPSPRQHISRYRNGASPSAAVMERFVRSTASSRSHASSAVTRQSSSSSVLATAVFECGFSATTP